MVGTGYVGLVTGACFAELGHDVICVDKDQRKIDMLRGGGVPIYEPGLEELIARNVAAGRLSFSTDVPGSVKGRDAVFIAVGTPSHANSDRANVRFVFEAAAEIAAALDQFTVVVTKSTVPVGTNGHINRILGDNVAEGVKAVVASNPEFLREGAAIDDFMAPDRVIVGCDDEQATELLRRIYAPICSDTVPFVQTNVETAELIKYSANAFLAIKVGFINEISDLCEKVGANVEQVAHGIGLDKRIGSTFLKVGPGWGGSCFPKDTRALHQTAQDAGLPIRIVESAIEANESRKKAMARRIGEACGGDVVGKKVAVLGLTFKGQTDDMRDSASLHILPILVAQGASVHAFDPSHPHEAAALLPEVTLAESPVEACQDADVVVVITDWKEFLGYDLRKMSDVMRSPVMVDLRNLYDAERALEGGFKAYHSLGRQPRTAEPSWVSEILAHTAKVA